MFLGPIKTRIYTAREFKDELDLNSADDDESATRSAVEILYEKAYANEDIDEKAVAELSALDLVGELKAAFEKDHWDVNTIRTLLRALRLTKSTSAIALIKADLRRFIPVIKDVVLLMEELSHVQPQAFADMSDEVIKIIQEPAAQRLQVIRAWLIELFLRNVMPITAAQLRQLDSLKGSLDLRQLCLVRMSLKDVNFFRRGKARIDELGDWQKPAFIFGASCLPRDEFETWLNAIKPRLKFPLASEFCDWARVRRSAPS